MSVFSALLLLFIASIHTAAKLASELSPSLRGLSPLNQSSKYPNSLHVGRKNEDDLLLLERDYKLKACRLRELGFSLLAGRRGSASSAARSPLGWAPGRGGGGSSARRFSEAPAAIIRLRSPAALTEGKGGGRRSRCCRARSEGGRAGPRALRLPSGRGRGCPPGAGAGAGRRLRPPRNRPGHFYN